MTSNFRQLDVRKLHKAGVLRPGHVGSWCWYRGKELRASIVIEASDSIITLRYSATRHGERNSYNYPVRLSWTACTYGGARPWFRCPRCLERVAILYGGAEFVCRHCRRLAYQVQRETDNDRTIRRADAIRERLGWQPGILNGNGWKPKGMHWRPAGHGSRRTGSGTSDAGPVARSFSGRADIYEITIHAETQLIGGGVGNRRVIARWGGLGRTSDCGRFGCVKRHEDLTP